MIRPVLASLFPFLVFAAFGNCAAADGIEVSVMSFNVRWDGLDKGRNAWENRRLVAIEMIKNNAPDVVGLQEPSPAQTRDLDEELKDYVAFHGGHNRDQHITFLYRSDRFRLAEGGSFWLVEKSDLSGGTRRCVWVRLVEKESRHAFYVFNSHFDHRSSKSRRQSALSLVRGIRNRHYDAPFVVLGDFNETENGPAMKYLMGAGPPGKGGGPALTTDTVLVDTFRTKHPTQLNAASAHGFSGSKVGKRIDYIFVRRQDEILDARIVHDNKNGLYPSDHFPVAARVRLVCGLNTTQSANDDHSTSGAESRNAKTIRRNP